MSTLLLTGNPAVVVFPRMAVLQLAVRDAAFLLDMVNLPKCVPETTLRQFMADVFGSDSQLKLGVTVVCTIKQEPVCIMRVLDCVVCMSIMQIHIRQL